MNELEQERGKAADTIFALASERDRVTEERARAVEHYGELLKVVDKSTLERDKLSRTVANLISARDQLSIQFDKLSHDHAGLVGQVDGLRLERNQLFERNHRLSQACELRPPRNFTPQAAGAINIILVIYALSHFFKYCRQVHKRRVHNAGHRQTEPAGPPPDSTKSPAEPTAKGPATDLDDPEPSQKAAKPTFSTPPSEADTPRSPRTLDRSIRSFNSRLELVESVVSDTAMRVHKQGTVLQGRGEDSQLGSLEGAVSDMAAGVHHQEQRLQNEDATSSAATEPLFEADSLGSEEEAEIFS